MTQEEILKRNKVIAEFDGHKINFGFNQKGILFLGEHINEDQLKYNSSWDWLMPVVEKIESIIGDGANFIIGKITYISFVVNATVKTIKRENRSKIENTFIAVSDFCEWYKLNKESKEN